MSELTSAFGTGLLYSILSTLFGLSVFGIATICLPRLVERFSPHIDEQKEIASGNQAVADYYGRIVSAAILGVSIIIATGIFVGLH